MSATRTVPRPCSIAWAPEVSGERWTLLVLREIHYDVHGFDAIQRNIGAPRDVLTKRLNRLVEVGVVERRQYRERPPRFEYHAAAAGHELRTRAAAARRLGSALDAGSPADQRRLHPRLRTQTAARARVSGVRPASQRRRRLRPTIAGRQGESPRTRPFAGGQECRLGRGQQRRARHLLLGKGAVFPHRSEHSLAAELDESQQRCEDAAYPEGRVSLAL